MSTSQLEYKVKKGEFIDKWLISDVIEKPFVAKMVPDSFPKYHPGASVKDENGKERKSPAKKEYLRIGSFKEQEYPEKVTIDKLYYPSDTTRVDQSGFWTYPCDIRLFSKTYVECESESKLPVIMYAAGALRIWVNGILQEEFYPYESNIEQKKEAILNLKKGKNEILVGLNDYGERNIVFKFGLENAGSEIALSLPVAADVDKISRMKLYLNSFYLDKLIYRNGDIGICSDLIFEEDFYVSVKVAGINKVVHAKAGEQRIVLFNVMEIPMGYQQFDFMINIDGVDLSTKLNAQIYQEDLIIDTPDTYEERRKVCLEYAANSKPSFDSYLAALELGKNDFDRCWGVILKEDLSLTEHRGDCADFRIARICWLLYRYRHLLKPEQIEDVSRILLGFRYWFDEPGNDAMWFFSENHALAFHTGEYLAGQYFKKEVFSNSGMTGLEHMEKSKVRIVGWFEKLLNYGYNEWNSATYVKIDILSYMSLYNFSEDLEMKELAKKALDYTFEMYAYNSFKGVMGTSNGRAYNYDILANECMAGNSQMWLAWGIGNMNQWINPVIYIAMSDYIPPKELCEIAVWDKKERLVKEKLEGTELVKTYVCKTRQYLLGSCHSPRTGGPGSQEVVLSMLLSDAKTRIWINHPGEGKIFGERRPGYFTGNALTPLVTQTENVAVMSYHFPKELLERAEVDYIHIMCDEQECDEVVLEGGWLFIRRGEAFAAIYSTNPIERTTIACLKGKEFIARGIESDWLIKVSSIDEFDGFASFIKYHIEQQPVTMKERQLVYLDYERGELVFPIMEEEYLRKNLSIDAMKELGLPII